MEELQKIRKLKSDAYVALQQCCQNLKQELQDLYDSLDSQETVLMESLDIDVD